MLFGAELHLNKCYAKLNAIASVFCMQLHVFFYPFYCCNCIGCKNDAFAYTFLVATNAFCLNVIFCELYLIAIITNIFIIVIILMELLHLY